MSSETEIQVSNWLVQELKALEGQLYTVVNSPKSAEGRSIKERYAIPSEVYRKLKGSPGGIHSAAVDAWKAEVLHDPTYRPTEEPKPKVSNISQPKVIPHCEGDPSTEGPKVIPQSV